MSRNGSGTYNRIAGVPYVYNTVIDQVVVNSELDDIATALTASLAKDGQTTPTANLPMGNYRHTSVGAATARTQYARAAEVQDNTLKYLTSTAGTNTITATSALSMTAYAVGQEFDFTPAATNTGAATLNINSIGAGAVQMNGKALAGGELRIGVPVSVRVTATTPVFEIVSNGAFVAHGIKTDIASAATLDLDAATSDYLSVTGTTTTTAVTLANGQRRTCVAAAAWPLTHGASLILPGAANYTCVAGDILHFFGEAAGVVRVEVENQALVPAVIAQATAEAGTDTAPRLWTAERVSQAIAALGAGKVKVVSFTRDRTTASGNQSMTGVGFVPKAAIFFAAVNNTSGRMSMGVDDGSSCGCVLDYSPVAADQWDSTSNYSIYALSGASEAYQGKVNSFDADGFTIAWTRTGSPTGTINIKALLFR